MPLDLGARIRKLEDIEAIKQLKARFAYYLDEGTARDQKDLAGLFSSDGECDFGYGTAKGREALTRLFTDQHKDPIPFSMHMFTTPLIEVKGDSGKGVWYCNVPFVFGPKQLSLWAQGRYDEEYVRVAGEWKFKLLKYKMIFLSMNREGWLSKEPLAEVKKVLS